MECQKDDTYIYLGKKIPPKKRVLGISDFFFGFQFFVGNETPVFQKIKSEMIARILVTAFNIQWESFSTRVPFPTLEFHDSGGFWSTQKTKPT